MGSSLHQVRCFLPLTAENPAGWTGKDSMGTFEKLVEDIKSRLGADAGLGSAHIDANELQKLMELYVSKEKEWSIYALSDMSRCYTRNLVDAGNGKSNLLILVWTPGKGSPVHDHANAHCIMKVLKGTLTETRYEWPSPDTNSSPLSITQQTTFGPNEVTYMSDKLGLHRISNPDDENVAVSLHLYTPPNAAKYGCNIFNAETGQSSHIQQCNYYSEFGERSEDE